MQQRHTPSYWGGIGMQMLLIFLICSLQFTGAHAQLAVTTATLSGTVMDPSGAIVPQATVTLTKIGRAHV